MPWGGSAPNQTFTRTDGTRTGTQVWQEASAASVKIVSPHHDNHDQDLADGLSLALKKDGGNSATANLPMGGFRHTNVGAALARTDYARFSDVQDQKSSYYPTVGGTADAITLTGASAAITAYAAGQRFTFKAAQTNTGAATVNVDSVGVKNIKGPAGAALAAGQILASAMVTIEYDGTDFQVQTVAPIAIEVGMVMAIPFETVPSGWLYCDGSAVSRTTYAALFNKIGTMYGVGDGSTTFNLPDYEDYFLRGFDASGTDASGRTDRGDGTTGASIGTKQASAFKRHTHTITDPGHTHTQNADTSVSRASGVDGFLGISGTEATGSATTGISVNNTSADDSTNETRAKNVTVKWVILALPAATLPVGSGSTVSPRLCHSGGMPARLSTDGTNSTPSVTETYICEVFIPAPTTVTGIAIFNGDAVAGNVAVALANSVGAVLASSAATAQAGTDVYQRVPFTAALSASGPGTFYILVQFSNTSARFNTHTFGDFGASKKTGEVFGTFTTVTPPTTFTTALGPIASLY